MDTAPASAIPSEIIIGFLVFAVTVSTWILRRAMRPIEHAVRPEDPSKATVLEAAVRTREATESLSADVESLRDEIRALTERQTRTEQWVTLIDTRIGTISEAQTQITSRLARVETSAARAHERLDLFRAQLPWPDSLD